MDNQLKSAEDIYSDAYRPEGESFGKPDRKIIAGLPQSGQKILSLGSGDGSDIWFLGDQNEVYALDGSPSAIEQAIAHGLHGIQHDLEKPIPFKDEEFNIVVCKDLLEHLVSPVNLLMDIHRVLKPSGYFIISIPNHFYLTFRIRILLGGNLIWKSMIHDHRRDYDEWNYMHLRFFTYKGLLRFLNIGGFKVEKGFWDFGTLAHYTSPDLYNDDMIEKFRNKPLTIKAKVFKYGVYPLWQFFNLVFPRQLRSAIVSLAPSVFCAGFYLRCVKKS